MENQTTRGQYGQIVKMPSKTKKMAQNLLKGVIKAEKVDEHGSWEFGILDSNIKKGMVHAINYNFFAVGKDFHSKKFLAVIQIREFYREKASYFAQIRKNYYLLGRNEDKTFFAHPVEGRVVLNAIKNEKDVVLAVQTWMFGSDYRKIQRQGDICMQKIRAKQGTLIEKNEVILEETHRLTGDEIYCHNSNIYYVLNPQLTHIKNTHPNIAGKGWHKVIIANRTKFWKFAAPTLD